MFLTSSANIGKLQRLYEAFASGEARGNSAVYERLATGVAESNHLLGLIATLPAEKQQPNLVLAAIRYCCDPELEPEPFNQAALGHWPEVRDTVMSRSTQTNEPGRCAVLLPLLASLPQPIALLEVGASAGLCLLPDHYGYRYNDASVLGSRMDPIFPCAVTGEGPLPSEVPTVVWRRGLDLNPVDVEDSEQGRWLEALVWPGQDERRARLRASLLIAKAHPPRVDRGDLRTDLQESVADAPTGATLVVFHTAVLAYVRDQQQRDAFARQVRQLGARWVSNEAASVFPDIAASLATDVPRNRFVLSVDGRPMAFTAPHGQALHWA